MEINGQNLTASISARVVSRAAPGRCLPRGGTVTAVYDGRRLDLPKQMQASFAFIDPAYEAGYPPIAGQPLDFIGATEGANATWTWDFGEPASGAANTATGNPVTHTYQRYGVYTVTAKATDDQGRVATVRRTFFVTEIVASRPPPAAPSIVGQLPAVGW